MALNSIKGNSSSFGVGAGRKNRSSYRRYKTALYRSTQFKDHWRSVGGTSVSCSRPLDPTKCSSFYNGAVALNFYSASGGAQPLFPGGGVPNFTNNLFIRGGTFGIKFENDDVSSCRIKVYLIRTTEDVSTYPGLAATSIPVAWDPTVYPDFYHRVGKIIWRRQFDLQYNSSEYLERKLKAQSYNRDAAQLGLNYMWLWTVEGADQEAGTAGVVRATVYWNLSFVGDAIPASSLLAGEGAVNIEDLHLSQ